MRRHVSNVSDRLFRTIALLICAVRDVVVQVGWKYADTSTMEVLYVYMGILLAVIESHLTTALQCPSCTYFMADKNMHGTVRNIAGEILEQFKDESCSRVTEHALKVINVEECLDIPGKISRCSFMVGMVTLTIPLTLLRDVDIKLQVFHRGCYYSTQAESPPVGCRTRKKNNNEATFIDHIVNEQMASGEPYKVSEFNGDMCICSDKYCSNMSSTSNNSWTISFPYRNIFHIMIFHLMLLSISVFLS